MKYFGVVRGLSQYYINKLERTEIWFNKKTTVGLPNIDGQRISIVLTIGSVSYIAGIRSTNNNPEISICPDLVDKSDNSKISLAAVLVKNNFTKNQKVVLEFVTSQKHFLLLAS
jgi:hypothetical protein